MRQEHPDYYDDSHFFDEACAKWADEKADEFLDCVKECLIPNIKEELLKSIAISIALDLTENDHNEFSCIFDLEIIHAQCYLGGVDGGYEDEIAKAFKKYLD